MDKLMGLGWVVVFLCFLAGVAIYLLGWTFEPTPGKFIAISIGTVVAVSLFITACVSNDGT